MKDLLLVAPEAPGLPELPSVSEEIKSIRRSGLSTDVLQGRVDREDLLDALTLDSYRILWIASHGTREGILLSEETLSTGILASLVKSQPSIDLIVLNTCESIHIASQLQQFAGADIICTISDVPDRRAWTFGALLSRQLASTDSFRQAFEVSRPSGDPTYVYLTQSQPEEHMGRLSVRLKKVEMEVIALKSSVDLISRYMRRKWSRSVFAAIIIIAWSVWIFQPTYEYFRQDLVRGIAITLVLLLIAIVIRWFPSE